MKIQKVILVFSLFFLLSGCVPVRVDTTYLTSKDRTWIIPRNTPFQALSDDKTVKQYQIDADLLVIYKGRYLELEQEANGRVLKAKKEGNNKAALFSGIATLVGIVITVLVKKKKKKND